MAFLFARHRKQKQSIHSQSFSLTGFSSNGFHSFSTWPGFKSCPCFLLILCRLILYIHWYSIVWAQKNTMSGNWITIGLILSSVFPLCSKLPGNTNGIPSKFPPKFPQNSLQIPSKIPAKFPINSQHILTEFPINSRQIPTKFPPNSLGV